MYNPFGSSGSFAYNGAALSFIFSTGGTNPPRACDAGDFTVSTFAVVNSQTYPIDYYTFDPAVDTVKTVFSSYKPTSALLSVTLPPPTSTVASAINVAYEFLINPSQLIPQNSVIVINFPTEIVLQAKASTTTCSTTISGSALSSTVSPVSTSSGLVLTIATFFQNGDYTSTGTPFTIGCTNFQNPRTLNPTATSFAISVTDPQGCAVSQISSGLIINMQSLPSFTSITVSPSNAYNGVLCGYTITVTPAIQMVTGDFFDITFPPEVTVTTPVCTAVLILKSVSSCQLVAPNQMQIGLVFTTSPNPIGTAFSFTVSNVKNA